MANLFGTDGVRGKAGVVLTAELALKLGQAAGQAFIKENGGKSGIVVIGRDTRISGQMLEAALTAGLTSVGVHVVSAGVIPTPAVALLVRHYNAMAGAVISASHNPYQDNGIKFFSASGEKISDETQSFIERVLQGEADVEEATGLAVGKVNVEHDAIKYYKDFLLGLLCSNGADVHAVVDCANGAASSLAEEVFTKSGVKVTMMGNHPDGVNINVDCGSTHLEALQASVLREGADVGLAFDGDADRFLAVDERGNVIDGDHLMAIFALALKKENRLTNNQLVITVMSNLGLKLAMKEADIEIIETKVGDRYVNEGMQQFGAILGGEQSGHIIFRDYNSTGDGMISAIMLLNVMCHYGKSAYELAQVMTSLPQVLINVPVRTKDGWGKHPAIVEAIDKANAILGEEGRVLVRASGTEDLLRVMVEGKSQDEITELANKIADAVREAIGV